MVERISDTQKKLTMARKYVNDSLFYYFEKNFYFPYEHQLSSGMPYRFRLRKKVTHTDLSQLARQISMSLFDARTTVHRDRQDVPLFKEAGFGSQDQLETKAVSIALILFNDRFLQIAYGGRSLSMKKDFSVADASAIAFWLSSNTENFDDFDVEEDDDGDSEDDDNFE